MPEERRVRLGDLAPLAPPAWASILDDVWAIHQAGGDEDDCVPEWFDQLDEAYETAGLERNVGKDANAVQGAEIQGGY
eukprot:1087798-Lingulodinium_polyedra.AAC.1